MGRNFQEEFWAGAIGDAWFDRNNDIHLISSNIALLRDILNNTCDVKSVCELGAGSGLNLIALHSLLPDASLVGVEINQKAVDMLAKLSYVKTKCCSIYDIPMSQIEQYDFVLVKGVLIHQDPSLLDKAYDILYNSSKRYIAICEYYNPTPMEVEYRGVKSILFKRDFPGDMLDKYPDLRLVNYGFIYHRDSHFPQDDINWFLLEKEN